MKTQSKIKFASIFKIFAPIMLFLLVSCGQATPEVSTTEVPQETQEMAVETEAIDTGGKPEELETVTVSIAGGLDHVPIVVGLEKGIFEEHGIDLKIKTVSSGIEIVQLQQSGETQFAPTGVPAFAIANQEALDLVVVALASGRADSEYYDSDVAITAREGSGIEVDQPETLRGKRIGVPFNSTAHDYIIKVLNAEDIALDEVELINIGVPDLAAALEGGDIDAQVIWEPLGVQALAKVAGSYVVLRDGGYANRQVFYATTPDWLANNHDLAKKYLTAFAHAFYYTRQQENWDEASDIATRWFTGLDYNTAREMIPFIQWDPRISKANCIAAAGSVDFLMQVGRLEERLDPCEFLDLSLLEEVMAEHPEFFDDLPPIPNEYELKER